MLNVFAKIKPKKELFNEALNKLESILEPTRSESGCMRFELYTDHDKSCLFLIERFANEDALAKHYSMQYTREVFQFYEHALVEPVQVEKFFEVSS